VGAIIFNQIWKVRNKKIHENHMSEAKVILKRAILQYPLYLWEWYHSIGTIKCDISTIICDVSTICFLYILNLNNK
jgi:hypothetical protein